MIITKLTGGLGNQMFQYAAGKALATEKKESLKLDTSSYNKNHKRVYSLTAFSHKAPEVGFFETLFTKLFFKSSYLDGYFQSEKYFKNITEAIQKDFSLSEPLEKKYPDIVQKIKNTNSVSVHVRRTDYLDKQYRYIVLDQTYYKKAMDVIEASYPNPTYFFFSDEIDWIKKNIPCPPGSEFMSGGKYTDAEELILMSMCKHNIIANSTFSWWGAWLNKNPQKIVVTPEKWFTSKYDDPELLPTEWTKI